MHFLDRNVCTGILIQFYLFVSYNSALVQIMAWHQTGDKPLPVAIMTQAYGVTYLIAS